jgi:hypothetical protein
MEQGSETEPGIEADTPIVSMMRSPPSLFATVRIRIQVFPYCLTARSLGLSRSEPRTLCGDSGWGFASVLGSAKLLALFESDLVTIRSHSNHPSLPYENPHSKHLTKYQGASVNWCVRKFHLPRSRAMTSSSTRMATTTSSANMRRSLN